MHLPGRRQPDLLTLTPAQTQLIRALNAHAVSFSDSEKRAARGPLVTALRRALSEAGARNVSIDESLSVADLTTLVSREMGRRVQGLARQSRPS